AQHRVALAATRCLASCGRSVRTKDVTPAANETNGHDLRPLATNNAVGTTDHAEAVRIEYDPAKVGYAKLVEFFYRTHDPTTVNRQGGDAGT
ncbi:peptide methionine sulfoxide reductase MsrA, partial [Mycena amicta]